MSLSRPLEQRMEVWVSVDKVAHRKGRPTAILVLLVPATSIEIEESSMASPQNLQPHKQAKEEASLPKEPLELSTYTLLVRVAARLEAELNRVFRPFDLTAATYNILWVLHGAGAGGRSCGDISEQLIAEVPDMTRLLDRLERLEYVARERSSVDRRMVKVTITEKGRSVLDGLRGTVQDCHIRQLGHLGEVKLTELSALLTLILSRGEVPVKHVAAGDTPAQKHASH